MAVKNIKLVISYDGSRFSGWQKQGNSQTVQGTIENTIESIAGKKIKITGCGRTDARVHAVCYVANFRTFSGMTPSEWKNAINSKTMPEIAIKDAEETYTDFHSRYDAKRKVYRYLISDTKSPFLKNYACYVKDAPDIKKMEQAACFFCGKHDFKSFQASGSRVKDTVRNIYKIKIRKERFLLDKDVGIISIEIEADGFLYRMARNIIGTLIYAGQGKMEPEKAAFFIESRNRKLAPPTARPEGLYLKKVFYPAGKNSVKKKWKI
ncbi:MAG TPA: tRNA pseudouridine(38-40) synthase TruA [bacterium]|nr:tRNA pseudouridine(38-40) synthase TruA [bacterium]